MDAVADLPLTRYLGRLLDRYAGLADGEVATYIPELAGADPSWFAISMTMVDGTRYTVGDAGQPFTIQSVSKPFTFAVALEGAGPEEVRRHVGVEPTGEAFNAITLDEETGTPLNPMVNAGAITATGLALAATGDGARLLEAISRFAGRPLEVDEAVCASEAGTGHRNRAIAHLLRGSGALEADADAVLDVYFRQCSLLVDAADLSVMAATLANGGVNPVTGGRAATASTTRSVLAVMASCGMYDGAGEWLYTVGLPAKSGVTGGIIAVLPGVLGLAVFSPPLDRHGNSVRGVRVCRDLSRELDAHLVRSGRHVASPIRSIYTLAQVGSKRQRTAAETELIARGGADVLVVELQGSLELDAAELVTRRVGQASTPVRRAVLDLRRVADAGPALTPLLEDLAAALAVGGGSLVLTGVEGRDDLTAELAPVLAAPATRAFPDLDLALEWCEDEVLGDTDRQLARVELADHELLAGLPAAWLEAVERELRPVRHPAGTLVVSSHQPVSEVLLVVEGHLSVWGPGTDERPPRRLATLDAGSLLGELAMASGRPPMIDVRADTEVEGWVLGADGAARLRRDEPELWAELLQRVVRIIVGWVERVRREVAALAE